MLSSGSSFFVPVETLAKIGIVIGSELSEEQIRLLEMSDQINAIRIKAFDYLARRDHSVWELSRKLDRRGFGRDLVARALRELQDRGHVDDARFAERWVKGRLSRHPEGASRLKAGLRSRGVDRRTIDQVVEEIFDEELEQKSLFEAAEKILRRKKMDRGDLLKALVARGFSYRKTVLYLEDNHFAGKKDN